MKWEQRQDATQVKLSDPLGLRSLQVQYSPGQLRLVTSRGEKLEGGAAEQALIDAISFVPPFDSLRFWVLGVPAPEASMPNTTFDADGLLLQLQQQDWMISYERRMGVTTASGVVQLPRKLVAARANLKLTLVIDRWSIK